MITTTDREDLVARVSARVSGVAALSCVLSFTVFGCCWRTVKLFTCLNHVYWPDTGAETSEHWQWCVQTHHTQLNSSTMSSTTDHISMFRTTPASQCCLHHPTFSGLPSNQELTDDLKIVSVPRWTQLSPETTHQTIKHSSAHFY